MRFPKNIFRFPSGGMSGRVEDRTVSYTGHSAPLCPQGTEAFAEGKKKNKQKTPSLEKNGKKKILLPTKKSLRAVQGHGD